MVLGRAVDQPNRWAFRCRANVNGERVAVHRAAGKLFQMQGCGFTATQTVNITDFAALSSGKKIREFSGFVNMKT